MCTGQRNSALRETILRRRCLCQGGTAPSATLVQSHVADPAWATSSLVVSGLVEVGRLLVRAPLPRVLSRVRLNQDKLALVRPPEAKNIVWFAPLAVCPVPGWENSSIGRCPPAGLAQGLSTPSATVSGWTAVQLISGTRQALHSAVYFSSHVHVGLHHNVPR